MVRARLLTLVFLCLASASLNSVCAQMFNGDPQNGRPGATATTTSPDQAGDSRASSSHLTVIWQSEKLSLDVEGAPLSEVLKAICQETGIEIEGAEGLNDPVFMHIAGMDLSQALQKLLSHIDHAIAVGPTGLASPRGTRVIILKRSAADSSGATSIAKTETNPTAPDAEEAIQVAATTTADSDPETSKLTAIQLTASAEDPSVVEQAQQAPNQPMQTGEQSAMTAMPGGGLGNTDPSLSANPVQQDTGSIDASAVDASIETPPTAEPVPDAVQTEKLAAVEAAATGPDREALSGYMKDSNATVQAAALDALAAHDNSAAVDSLLKEINDVGEANRLQALQLLSQSPQVDEQTVMTTLLDALNSADPLLSSYAAQALATRGTSEAMNALSDMLNTSDVSTRLTILQSVAETEAGLPLLRAALSDSDEAVRSVAAALIQLAETTRKP